LTGLFCSPTILRTMMENTLSVLAGQEFRQLCHPGLKRTKKKFWTFSLYRTKGVIIFIVAFPQEKAVGGKLIIYAFMVDTLEEYYETPGNGLQRWQMQLGEEDEGYLRRM
jgi:hypothetical protein